MIYFRIKNIPIRKKAVLAPMLEFTNLPFRLLAKEYGAGLTYTEMIHVQYLLNANISEIPILKTDVNDTPTAVQLVGDFTKKETIDAAHKLDNLKSFDIIDFNFGCPSQKVMAGNAGSMLLKDISKSIPIIKEIKETTNKPITVKTRLGYNQNNINEIIANFEKANIDGIAIHARASNELYNVKSNDDVVKNLISKTSIPIIYNGDVNEDNFQKFLDFPGIMIGRAALGNLFVFKQINNFLKNSSLLKKNELEGITELKRYLQLCEKYNFNWLDIKKTVIPFISGFNGASNLRNQLSQVTDAQQFKEIINKQLM